MSQGKPPLTHYVQSPLYHFFAATVLGRLLWLETHGRVIRFSTRALFAPLLFAVSRKVSANHYIANTKGQGVQLFGKSGSTELAFDNSKQA